MSQKLTIIFLLILFSGNAQENSSPDYKTIFETSNGTKTATYQQTIDFYLALEKNFPSIKVFEMGRTDSGLPLHLVIFDSNNTNISIENFSKKDKNLLLINNGIHPGEPDGVDATMMLFRDLAQKKISSPRNTIIATIPIYNIGGSLNRNSTTRTNQNGPEEYGFRGNARNFDLNRDFIKSDTKNARAFAEIFHKLNPDLFIDNHVSNGADYQYVLTHLFTQHNKLGGKMGDYLNKSFRSQLESSLQNKKWDITPYVNVSNEVPEIGFSQFFDSPRYSTGYAGLFNTFGMMVETHMLKPYKQRVEGTYELMKSFIEIADKDSEMIKDLRKKSLEDYKIGKSYPITWELDSTKHSTLNFKGFEGKKITSKVTGAERLKYDDTKPFNKKVSYFDSFKPKVAVSIPSAYIIPQGWWNVIELLKLNGIEMLEVKSDTILAAEVYKIEDYKTVNEPYEGHYLHYKTKTSTIKEKVTVKKGDVIVSTQQAGVRYLLETLEPSATDSFFNWNFFDTILQQKEGFSPYVWEDKAEKFLQDNPEVKKQFEAKRTAEPDFSKNWYLQLDWIHKQSPNYEQSHLRYPIVRVGG